MKLFIQIIISVLFISFSSQIEGQNRITVTLGEFTSLSVSGRTNVELVPSETNEMSIKSRNGKPEEVAFEIKNGELSIKTKPDLKKENEISIKIPYKSLTRIEAATGAVINSREVLKGTDLELKVLAGGKIEISVDVKTIDAKVTQASDIILYGKTVSQNVVANTGGNYLAYELGCEKSTVKASSGAQIKVTANKIIDATSNSKAYVGYIGEPGSATTRTSLSGKIASFKTSADAINN